MSRRSATTPTAEGSVAAPPKGDYRLLVDSVGTADAGVVKLLRGIVAAPESELAVKIYCAPSVLLEGIAPEFARRTAKLLESVGLRAHAEPDTEPFAGDTTKIEVAIAPLDAHRISAVATEVACLLGVDPATAIKISCSSPAVLVSGVSRATAEAIASRFSSYAVEIDVSDPLSATYDAAIAPRHAAERRWVEEYLRRKTEYPSFLADGASMMLPALSYEQATAAIEEIGWRGVPIKVVNRDFHRFDVQLLTIVDREPIVEMLRKDAAIPGELIDRVLSSLPIVIAENVSFAAAAELLSKATTAGAAADAVLLSFREFGLEIQSVGEAVQTREILSLLADDPKSIDRVLNQGGGPIGLRTGRVGAQWMCHQLQRVGTEAEVTT